MKFCQKYGSRGAEGCATRDMTHNLSVVCSCGRVRSSRKTPRTSSGWQTPLAPSCVCARLCDIDFFFCVCCLQRFAHPVLVTDACRFWGISRWRIPLDCTMRAPGRRDAVIYPKDKHSPIASRSRTSLRKSHGPWYVFGGQCMSKPTPTENMARQTGATR